MAEHNSSKSPLASLAETLRYRPSIHSCGKFRGFVLCVSVDDISTIWRGDLMGREFLQKTVEITRKLMEKDHQIIC